MVNFEDFIIKEKTLEKLKNQSEILDCLEKGESLQEILGFSDEVILEFYSVAKEIFEQKRYEEAIKAFSFLTYVAPHISAFWLGLGLAQQNNQEWEKGINSFQNAMELDPKHIIAYKFYAECLMEMGKVNQALDVLGLAEKYCYEHSEDPECLELKNETEKIKQDIKNKS